MVRPEAESAIQSRGRLIFKQDGEKKYLAEVWIAGSSMHSEMAVVHKQEQTLAQREPKVPTIEIAMK